VSSGANWKHTTSAIARDDYGNGFFLATKTYLEYSGIPDWTLGISYVYQLKEKMYLGRITIIVRCLDGQLSDIKSFIEK
jgi:hypothetical protein